MNLLLSVIILRLIEEEIRGQFLVLLAGEVCLDYEVAFEAEAAELFIFVSTGHP